jgi:hypothetical protein
MKTLKRIKKNCYGYMMYQDEKGNWYADIHYIPGNTPKDLYRVSPSDDIDGEPDYPINDFTIENPETDKEIREANFQYVYMMLSRLRGDCIGFLTEGDIRYHNVSQIWGVTVESHIAHMKELWEKIDDDLKPEWCSWEQILEYERNMTNL